jgi:DNA-binding beta-propeller fold protein YncE
MRRTLTSALVAVAASAVALIAAPAAHAQTPTTHDQRAVFVQTNDPTGNSVVAYRRAANGHLTKIATYETLGLGGEIAAAPVDALASQNSLLLDPTHHLLLAVNAGSDTVSAFRVDGTDLHLLSVTPSRGAFPVSLTVHGDTAYVLNAGSDGSIAGFWITPGGLAPIANSRRSLGLANTAVPNFITAPGEVGFSPDGRDLIVTTKANNTIDVFPVLAFRPALHPVVNASAGAVPFSFAFDGNGFLTVTEAGPGAVSTYRLHADGSLQLRSGTVTDGGAAVCWIVNARGFTYVSNTGSSSLSAYRLDASGTAHLVGFVATIAGGAGAPTDNAVTQDQRFLYVLDPANGQLDGFGVQANGHLTAVTTVTGLPAFSGGAGPEGVVAV